MPVPYPSETAPFLWRWITHPARRTRTGSPPDFPLGPRIKNPTGRTKTGNCPDLCRQASDNSIARTPCPSCFHAIAGQEPTRQLPNITGARDPTTWTCPGCSYKKYQSSQKRMTVLSCLPAAGSWKRMQQSPRSIAPCGLVPGAR